MVKKIVAWYVSRYMHSEYIHKDKIKDELFNARNEEAKKAEKKYSSDLEHLKKLKDTEKHIAVSACEAEIKRLEQVIDEYSSNKKVQDLIEIKNRQIAQENFTLAVELKLCMNKILEMSAEMTGKIDILERETQGKLKLLEGRE
jgi:hypothetical protein